MLADGTYEALVVDTASSDAASDGMPDLVVLSLVITAGAAKGEVVDVQAASIHEPLELLAMPCILVVAGGQPSVVFD
jgi:hypothetical protein